jgi:Flp pilus assembly protein TadG
MQDDRQAEFAASESGSVSLMLGLMLIVLLASIGSAVDYARWHDAHSKTQDIVDSAVLAASRIWQTTGNSEEAIAAGQTYMAETSKSRIAIKTTSTEMALAADGKSLEASITGSVATPFLNMLSLASLPINVKSKAEFASGSNMEISLMLDFTGSMCSDGQGPCTSGAKVDGLRAAATDLVNIVVPETPGDYQVRVAVVPFSTRIRVDVDNHDGVLMKKLTNLDLSWSGWFNWCTAATGGNGTETAGNWHCTQHKSTYIADWRVMPCVTERAYGLDPYINSQVDYSDDAPGLGKWLNAHSGHRAPFYYDSGESMPNVAADNGATEATPTTAWTYEVPGRGCSDVGEENRIIPLTSDKSLLTSRIAQMTAGGATGGIAATSWSWYLLSPKWNNIWSGASEPGTYADVTTKQANGAPKLRKVAILMTDGVYNAIRHDKSQDATIVSNHAKKVCAAMKAAGIEIYTVGFALQELPAADSARAEDLLKSCGTDIKHFYSSLDVGQLQDAFHAIGTSLSPLHLTQ